MSLLVACVLAVIVIIGYWALLYAGVWLGYKIAIWSLTKRYGTADPDQLLKYATDRIRGRQKP